MQRHSETLRFVLLKKRMQSPNDDAAVSYNFCFLSWIMMLQDD